MKKIVKQHLDKAKDSMLLAVEIYNKPRTAFKTGGFISLAITSWTALFHAYFLHNNIQPYYRKGKKNRYEYIIEVLPEGKQYKQKKYWDISKCIKQYFKGEHNAVRANLELMVSLRNIIVHRHLPEIDSPLYGYCQALVDNFNNFLEKHFGEKHIIRELLAFSIQFLPYTISNNSNDADKILRFIKNYTSSLPSKILEDPKFTFNAILIRVKNHEGKDILPIKFIKYEDLSEELKENLDKIGLVIEKPKQIKVPEDERIKECNLTYKEMVTKCREIIPFLFNNVL